MTARECLSPASAGATTATVPGKAGLGHCYMHPGHPEVGGMSHPLWGAALEKGSEASANANVASWLLLGTGYCSSPEITLAASLLGNPTQGAGS